MYHLHVRTVRKSAGESSAESAAYMTRTGKHKSRGDIVRNIHQLNMPSWVPVGDTLTYWQKADSLVSRVNARSAYLIDFALPRQLPRKVQSQLAVQFAHEISSLSVLHEQDKSLPMLLVIHEGNGKNPHAHLLISTSIRDTWARSAEIWFKRYNPKLPGTGGARRADFLGKKTWLYKVRELWAHLANVFLRRLGLKTALDHRSYKSAAMNKIPQLHLGPSAAYLLAAQRPAPRVVRYQEQMSRRTELELQKEKVQKALEQVQQSDQAEIDFMQRVNNWQHQNESEFQTLLADHPLASNARSLMESATVLVIERGESSKNPLPGIHTDEDLRRRLIDVAGPPWHAMMGQGGLYFLRPDSDNVVLIGRGYVATDTQDEEALRLMLSVSAHLFRTQPAVYCDPALADNLKHGLHALGLVWDIRELPLRDLRDRPHFGGRSRPM